MTHQDIDSCKRDIEIIKSTIEKSKVNLGSIARLFIIYGASLLVLTVSQIILSRFSQREWYTVVSTITPYAGDAIQMTLFIFYLANYIKLKKQSNFYTLQLYRLWGVIMFVLPIISSCSMAIIKAAFGNYLYTGAEPRLILLAIPGIPLLFSFIFALLATGFMLNKKSIVIIAACLFSVLLMLYFLAPPDFSIYEQYDGMVYGALYSYIGNRTLIGNIVKYLGYVIIGVILRPRKRRYYGA